MIPILALIFSSIALYQIKNKEEGKTLSIIGLILGIVYTVMYLSAYGHM